MATRYKAKSGSNYPDLDMLDTMWDENEQVHTSRGAKVAMEAARAALDMYRMKAAPPASRAGLRAALTHALGAKLAAMVFGTSTKQAPGDWADVYGQQLAEALRRGAVSPGGSREQAEKVAQQVIAQVSGQRNTTGGSLADDEKATKETRWSRANDAFDALLLGSAQAAGAMVRGTKEQDDALGMNNEPWYR